MPISKVYEPVPGVRVALWHLVEDEATLYALFPPESRCLGDEALTGVAHATRRCERLAARLSLLRLGDFASQVAVNSGRYRGLPLRCYELDCDLESGRDHIVALHLKETVPGKFREIPFLTGHVDFPAVIAKAWDLGVRRFVTEMWDVGNPTWREDIIFANTQMRALLDQQK